MLVAMKGVYLEGKHVDVGCEIPEHDGAVGGRGPEPSPGGVCQGSF